MIETQDVPLVQNLKQLQMLTVNQVSTLFNLHKATVQREMSRKDDPLPSVLVSARGRRIPVGPLEDWVKRQPWIGGKPNENPIRSSAIVSDRMRATKTRREAVRIPNDHPLR